jgi:hypothetical protein
LTDREFLKLEERNFQMTPAPTPTRVLIATITVVAALGLVLLAAPRVHAAGLRNCAEMTGRAACYEIVWANGVEVRMTFANLEFAGARSSDNLDNFYVVAPQTDTPQGPVPFPHDHVVGNVPPQNHGEYSVHWHGFFVLCSAQGIASGSCLPGMTSTPLGPLAMTVNGQMLTSVELIESAANSGLLMLVDTGGVFVGTINPRK